MSSPHSTTAPSSVEPISAAVQEVIDQLKSDHAKVVAALTKDFKDNIQLLSSDKSELTKENGQLRTRLKGLQETIDHKEKLLYLLTGGGAPAPEDPCNLCGRVGKVYAEDKGERTAQRVSWMARPWGSRKDDAPQIIGNDQDGKHLLESNGGYMIESTDGDDWRRFQIQVRDAWRRKMAGTEKESHRQLLKQPFPTDEEITSLEGRRNIMTGWLKPLGAGSYDEWFTKHKAGLVDFPSHPGYDTQDPAPHASAVEQDLPLEDGNQGTQTRDLVGSAAPSNELTEQANSGEVTSHDWTKEEMEFAQGPATGSDPWSQIPPAWYGEATFGDKTGDDSRNESERESSDDEVEEGGYHKGTDGEGAESTEDIDKPDGGSTDSDETVKAAS